MRSCAAIPSRCRLITFLALLGVASGLALSFVLPLPTNSRCPAPSPVAPTHLSMVADSNASDQAASSKRDPFRRPDRGKLLVLGGTGFLGNSVAARAVLDGYSVTSLSRRGLPPSLADGRATVRERGARRLRRGGRGGGGGDYSLAATRVDYRAGDARDSAVIASILSEGGYVGIVHSVGVLFDPASRLSRLNRLASGSGSVPDQQPETGSYDEVTRRTAFAAMDAAEDYVRSGGGGVGGTPLPFVFSSSAEVGWQDTRSGRFVERTSPGWMRRYLAAKRAVETRLLDTSQRTPTLLRPIVFRSSLIYSADRIASLPVTSAFYVGSRLGLPFVDRPVTVQALSSAMLRSIRTPDVIGIQSFRQVDQLNQ